MTACSRRNFVSGMGALILMTGTSVTSLAKEEKADKPKRYAMVHDETACIGCTACARVCPVSCISGAPKQKHVIDEEKCIACGACYTACKFQAVLRP